MKKSFFSLLILSVLMVSCNQKNKETTTDESHMMGKDTSMTANDTMKMNDKTKMMDEKTAMYACPMHPEVQGKLNDKCPKCGMKLTEPVK